MFKLYCFGLISHCCWGLSGFTFCLRAKILPSFDVSTVVMFYTQQTQLPVLCITVYLFHSEILFWSSSQIWREDIL